MIKFKWLLKNCPPAPAAVSGNFDKSRRLINFVPGNGSRVALESVAEM